MSQLPWEPEVAEEAAPQQKAEDAGALTLSVDEFTALEERIRRAVGQLKQERLARSEAEERAAKAEAQLQDQEPRVALLEKELSALRAERDHVRQRVERLLSQLDALEL
jgi:septal ring factor EnvC (AmiA/AmiB activator)